MANKEIYSLAQERNPVQVGDRIVLQHTSAAQRSEWASMQSIYNTYDTLTSTLTNKTITAPKITGGSFTYTVSGGALTGNATASLPVYTGTDTFVFANLAQTIQSKTLSNSTISNKVTFSDGVTNPTAAGELKRVANSLKYFDTASRTLATLDGAETLTNKTINAAGPNTITITSANVSDFNTAVQANAISSLAAATGSIDFNSQRGINLAAPTSPSDAARKSYVDSVAATGLHFLTPAEVGTTADITLSGEQTIDGILTSTSRVLVKDQADATENGVYLSAAGAWARTTDADEGSELPGATLLVTTGTANAGNSYTCNNTTVTIGSDDITWVQFASGSATITAGDGLNESPAGTFVVLGTANRIAVSGSGVDIDAAYVGQASITDLGTVTTGTWNADILAVDYGGFGVDVSASTGIPTFDGLGVVTFVAAPTGAVVGTTDAQELDNKTFTANGLLLRNPADSFNYTIAAGAIGLDRTASLPALTGNDEFAFKDHAQELKNKTINLSFNTFMGAKTQFDTALSDGNFQYGFTGETNLVETSPGNGVLDVSTTTEGDSSWIAPVGLLSTITNLVPVAGTDGQIVRLRGNGDMTIQHNGSTISLAQGVSMVPSADHIISLQYRLSSTRWIEI